MVGRHRLLGVLGLLFLLALGFWWLMGGAQDGSTPLASGTEPAAPHKRPPELLGADAPRPKTDEPKPKAPEPSEALAPEPSAPVPPTYPGHVRGIVLNDKQLPLGGVRMTARSRVVDSVRHEAYTDKEGRFLIAKFPEGAVSVVVRPGGRMVQKAKRVEMRTGDDVRIVLETNPWVDVLFIDSETGMGLRTKRMETYMEENGKVRLSTTSTTVALPEKPPKPYGFRWIIRMTDWTHRLQGRAEGYEDSAWVDGPTVPQTEPLRILMRPDRGAVASLTISVRTETGEELNGVSVYRRRNGRASGGGGHRLREGGELTISRMPGTHDIQVGSYMGLPKEPCDWYVPQALQVVLGRGETARRNVILQRGGFVKFRGFEGMHDVEFKMGDFALTRDANLAEDDGGDFYGLGPFAPGTWTFTHRRGNEKVVKGTFTIVPGKITEVRANPGAARKDD